MDRRTVVAVVPALGALVALLAGCGGARLTGLPPTTPQASTTVARPTRSTTPPVPPSTAALAGTAALVGDWLGPFPGGSGNCSPEYSEFFIYASGSYTSTWNSEPLRTVPVAAGSTTTSPQYASGCEGGGTVYGRWSAQANVLTFAEQYSNIPTYQVRTYPVTFSFVNGDLRLCDDPADGLCWDYARQAS